MENISYDIHDFEKLLYIFKKLSPGIGRLVLSPMTHSINVKELVIEAAQINNELVDLRRDIFTLNPTENIIKFENLSARIEKYKINLYDLLVESVST